MKNPELVSMINKVAEAVRKQSKKMEQWAIIKREQNKINHNRERIRNLQHIFKECLRNEAFEKCAELEDTILDLEIQNLISNSIIAY